MSLVRGAAAARGGEDLPTGRGDLHVRLVAWAHLAQALLMGVLTPLLPLVVAGAGLLLGRPWGWAAAPLWSAMKLHSCWAPVALACFLILERRDVREAGGILASAHQCSSVAPDPPGANQPPLPTLLLATFPTWSVPNAQRLESLTKGDTR